MTLTYGSLFAGIGGFDLGFDQAALQCAWQVEIDPACQSVLQRHWPDVPKFGDIREAGAHNLPPVDIICGGFPCQGLSVAGNRAGLADERSGLFFEMLRVIYELQPLYAIWENVPGLLSSCSCRRCQRRCARCGEIAGADDEACDVCGHTKFSGRVLPNHRGADFFTVISSFGFVGYDGAWTLLDAQYFGLAQRRRRLFGVFARRDIGAERCAEILSFTPRMCWHPETRKETEPTVAGSLTSRFGKNGGASNGDVTANRVIAFGGNNTTGPVSIATHCNAHPSKRYDFESETFVVGSLHNGTPGRCASDAADGKIIMAFDHSIGGSERTYIHRKPGYAQLQANRADSVLIAPTLSSKNEVASSSTQRKAWYKQSSEMFGAVRRLTPLECLRLQGFPDDYQEMTDANAEEENARKVLHLLWKSVGKKTPEEWEIGIHFSLLTPEILLSGVHGGWLSWEVAAKCASTRRQIQGENYCTEKFVQELWRNKELGRSPYRRESFEQCARELGSIVSELPYHYSQGWAYMLHQGVQSAPQGTWLLRQALSTMEKTRRSNEDKNKSTPLSDSPRYRQLGNAVPVPIARWLAQRLLLVHSQEQP